MTGHLYVAPDAYGDPTVWLHRPETPDAPQDLMSEHEIHPLLWSRIIRGLPVGPPAEVTA